MENTLAVRRNISIIVIVASLGYFVDIYDLILFSIVRIPSLKSLGLEGEALTSKGIMLLNMQMAGMLTGGIIWGILGDKRGRIKVLFGSIFLYSIANIANGYVQDISTYATIRFLAGVGLAGELGAGITLVSEVMPKETRGYGTMIVASVGLLGAVVASLVGDTFDWRIAYYVGGGLGLVLLFLRIGLYESGMYSNIQKTEVGKGRFLKLFTQKRRFLKYAKCILIGMPTWFVIGVLITLSPEFARTLGIDGVIAASKSVMYAYIGLVVGDLASGYLSQILKTRKNVVLLFLILNVIFISIYLFLNHSGIFYFYTICFLLGFSNGYWAVFVTNASEQFGTNLRATVTTTTPNFIRGSLVPISLTFQLLSASLGIIYSAAIVGFVCLTIAIIATIRTEETYGKDLDYVEAV
jgi:putative MFS transporter